MKRGYIHLTIIVLCLLFSFSALADWRVIDAHWRPDENPWAETQVWDDYTWTEGWGEPEQFFPKYFKPAGSLHVILCNPSIGAATLALTHVDGEPLEEVLTSRQQAGRVIWHLVTPKMVAPAEWAECIVRLREPPVDDVRLTFSMVDHGTMEVSVPANPKRARLESVSFSPSTDRLYVYAKSLDGHRIKGKRVRLDGGDLSRATMWTYGPQDSDLLLAVVELNEPLVWGTYHLLEVDLTDGETLVYPIRAWDNYFAIGLFGDVAEERVKEAQERNFNTYVLSRENKLFDDLGINYIVRYGVNEGRARTPTQSGALFYNNIDEPDAHDCSSGRELPFMDRLGVNAEYQVLPRYLYHLRKDPSVLSMVLTNNTYQPLNYYVYGQTSDVLCTDPYVPLGGEQVDLPAHALECARDACAPCPLVCTIWAAGVSGIGPRGRMPLPDEERMMVFYALGAGVKGLTYFADRIPRNTTGEQLVASSQNKPLWDEMGRINADVAALSPYLAIGCPSGPPMENEEIWYRSIMCGRDAMALIVVNTGHLIDYDTPNAEASHEVAPNVSVNLKLPRHFRRYNVLEIEDGSLKLFENYSTQRGTLNLTLDEVDTARAFVIEAEETN